MLLGYAFGGDQRKGSIVKLITFVSRRAESAKASRPSGVRTSGGSGIHMRADCGWIGAMLVEARHALSLRPG